MIYSIIKEAESNLMWYIPSLKCKHLSISLIFNYQIENCAGTAGFHKKDKDMCGRATVTDCNEHNVRFWNINTI